MIILTSPNGGHAFSQEDASTCFECGCSNVPSMRLISLSYSRDGKTLLVSTALLCRHHLKEPLDDFNWAQERIEAGAPVPPEDQSGSDNEIALLVVPLSIKPEEIKLLTKELKFGGVKAS